MTARGSRIVMSAVFIPCPEAVKPTTFGQRIPPRVAVPIHTPVTTVLPLKRLSIEERVVG